MFFTPSSFRLFMSPCPLVEIEMPIVEGCLHPSRNFYPILLVALCLFKYKYSCNFKLLPGCYQNSANLSCGMGSAFAVLLIYVFLLGSKHVVLSNPDASALIIFKLVSGFWKIVSISQHMIQFNQHN